MCVCICMHVWMQALRGWYIYQMPKELRMWEVCFRCHILLTSLLTQTIHTHTHTYIYTGRKGDIRSALFAHIFGGTQTKIHKIYIHVCTEREREKERAGDKETSKVPCLLISGGADNTDENLQNLHTCMFTHTHTHRAGDKETFEVPCLLISGGADNTDENLQNFCSTLIIYSHANSEDLGSIRPTAVWLSHM